MLCVLILIIVLRFPSKEVLEFCMILIYLANKFDEILLKYLNELYTKKGCKKIF